MLHIPKFFTAIDGMLSRQKHFQAAQCLATVLVRLADRERSAFCARPEYIKLCSNKRLCDIVYHDPLFEAWLTIQQEKRKLAQAKTQVRFEQFVDRLNYETLVKNGMP